MADDKTPEDLQRIVDEHEPWLRQQQGVAKVEVGFSRFGYAEIKVFSDHVPLDAKMAIFARLSGTRMEFEEIGQPRPQTPTQLANLARLEDLLVEHIPKRAAELKIEPVLYSMRVLYYGSDTCGSRVPDLMFVPEEWRRQVIEKGEDVPQKLWASCDTEPIALRYSGPEENAPDVVESCVAWYEEHTSYDDIPMAEELLPFREMVQRVCRRLNALDWSTILRTTPDFIVFPADYTLEFNDDFADLEASVPAEIVASFRARGLF